MVATPSPPPPQTVPAAEATNSNEDTTECPLPLPHALHVIKEIKQHDKDDDYIQLISTIAPKKKRMLFLPIDFNNVKIDALVDSLRTSMPLAKGMPKQ